MKRFMLIGLWVYLVYWLVPSGANPALLPSAPMPADAGNCFVAGPASSLQMPEQPPFYLFSKEETIAELITPTIRFQYIKLPDYQMAASQFNWREHLFSGTDLNNSEAVVPAYLLGHAWLC